MMKTLNLKAALALAGLLSVSGAGFAADAMSRDQVKAEKERIEADYSAAKDSCKQMNGNAKDVCMEQAKGDEKVAKAQLDWKQSGKDKDRQKVADTKADADYAVAKEKCDELAGNSKDVCMKDAKAAHTKAKADAKANHEVGEAKKDAMDKKANADYSASKERCDSLSGDAKADCVAAAKAKAGKS
jgi:hypothetical protein